MRDQEENPRLDQPDDRAEPTDVKIDDLVVTPADLASLNRLDKDLESLEQSRPDDDDAFVDTDPEIKEDDSDKADKTELEQNEPLDGSIEPVGRVGNVQSAFEAPRSHEGDKPPSAELAMQQRTTFQIGSGEHTYFQEVSDAARAKGLGWMSVGNVPVSRDDGRGAVGAFEAAAERHRGRTDEERAKGLVICDVDTDHGHRSQQILAHAKEKDPDLYNSPGFRVVVTARSQERLDLISNSGAFAGHEGKVSFEPIDPEKPRLPEGTLLALAPEVNNMPVTRFFVSDTDIINKRTGEVTAEAGIVAAAERNIIRGEGPVITPDADDGDVPKTHWPHGFDKYYTSTHADARAEFEPAIRRRVEPEFKPMPPEDTDVGWRDTDIEEFMEGCPPGTTIKSWQPDVPDAIAKLSRQAELVYVDGFFRYGNQKLDWPRMSRREGELWRHTTHAELVTQGAGKAGARAYVPERGNGAFNHILIDRSPDEEARGAVRETFDGIVSAAGADTASLIVKGAETRLENEKQRLAARKEGDEAETTETVSAVSAIEKAYRLYVERSPVGAVDHEFALSLANKLYQYGHYDQAITFADRAIQAAPQMAANAHHLRAQALIMGGQRYDEANNAIKQALAISPGDPKLYRTQAYIAYRQGNYSGYAEARTNDMRYAAYRPDDAPGQLKSGWSAVCRALLRESEVVAAEGGTEPVAVTYTHRDSETGDVSAGTALASKPVDRSAVLRSHVVDVALASAQAMELAYAGKSMDRVRAVGVFDKIIDRAAWRRDPNDPDSEVIPPHELVPDDLHIVGAAAIRAAESAPGRELATMPDRPAASLSGLRERSPYAAEDIAVGQRVNERGDSLGPFSIELKTFNKPVIVEGATGSGKTTTVSNMALELGKEGIPWMIIDAGPSPSYGGLPERAAQTGVEVFYWNPTKDDISMPTLDLMSPVRGATAQDHLQGLMRWVQTVSNGGEPLPQLVGKAAYSIYADAGYDVRDERGFPNLHKVDNPTVPGIHEFADLVVHKAAQSGYSRAAGDVTAFADNRVGEIHRMERMLGDARPIDWDWLFDHNVVVDLSNMEGPLKQAWAAGLQTMYGEYLKTRFSVYGGENIGLQHVTFVEEAHHLYGIPVSAEAAAQHQAAQMWAERTTAYRKLGEGTVIITQDPSNIIDEVMKNADLYIAHRNPAQSTREVVGSAMGIRADSSDFELMRDLKPGQALTAQAGNEVQIVRMAEPAELDGETKLVKVDIAASRPPVQEAIRGGRRPPDGSEPYSDKELEHAYVAAHSPEGASEHASWIIHGTQVALGLMTGEELGALPEAMQRQWNQMGSREREALLDEVGEIVVGERESVLREFFSTAELKTALITIQRGMLNGQPLAGNHPGKKFLIPQLVGAHAYEQLKQPFGKPTPSPRARAWPIKAPLPGVNTPVTKDGHVEAARTVRDQIRALERSPISTVGSDSEHAHNRKVAWVALLGANGGRTLFNALGNFARGRRGNEDEAEFFARVRHAEEEMGLVRPGEPRPGPLTEYLSREQILEKRSVSS